MKRRARPRPRFPGRQLCALTAAALVLGGCGDRAGSAHAGGGPTRPAGRVVAEGSLAEVFRVGGSLEDTILLGPARLAADEAGVWVGDPLAGRVLRFDRGGRLLFASGARGGGPGEFRSIRDLAVDDVGRLWVLDRSNARITVVGSNGAIASTIPLEGPARSADQLAPLPSGGDVDVVVYDRARPFLRLSPDGRIDDRFGPPWAGFPDLEPLASQLVIAAGHGGRWAAAFAMGDGFFIRNGPAWIGGRWPYVEEVPFPRVETRGKLSSDGTGMVEERIAGDRPVFAALSASVVGDRLAVLFGGRSPERGRWLDVYGLDDGRYRGSLLLPEPFFRVALGGGRLYGLASRPAPALVALELAADSLP